MRTELALVELDEDDVSVAAAVMGMEGPWVADGEAMGIPRTVLKDDVVELSDRIVDEVMVAVVD